MYTINCIQFLIVFQNLVWELKAFICAIAIVSMRPKFVIVAGLMSCGTLSTKQHFMYVGIVWRVVFHVALRACACSPVGRLPSDYPSGAWYKLFFSNQAMDKKLPPPPPLTNHPTELPLSPKIHICCNSAFLLYLHKIIHKYERSHQKIKLKIMSFHEVGVDSFTALPHKRTFC